MIRIALQGVHPAALKANERLRLTVLVTDDMGEDAGDAGQPIGLTVHSVGEEADHNAVVTGQAEPALGPSLTDSHGGQLAALSCSCLHPVLTDEHYTVNMASTASACQPQPDRPSGQLALTKSSAAAELSCRVSIKFSERLHSSNSSVLVTLSSPGALPMTVGPIALCPSTQPAPTAPTTRLPASISRELRTLPIEGTRSGGEHVLALRMLEQSASDCSIAGSLWAAGMAMGAFLSVSWLTDIAGLGICPDEADAVGISAVEVGCGTGCAGLMLATAVKASLGAGGCKACCVQATDGDEQAVEFAEKNARVNGLQTLVQAREVSWEEVTPAVASSLFAENIPCRLVFAADVVYNEKHFAALVSSLHTLATVPSGSGTARVAPVWLAYRLRMEQSAADHFWHIVSERFDVLPAVHAHKLEAAMDAWGLHIESGNASGADQISLYRLQAVESLRPTGCAYCQRWLKPRQ